MGLLDPPGQQQIANSDGRVSRPWLLWFTALVKAVLQYQTVKAAGVALPQEAALNFLAPLTAVDNPGAGSTDVGLADSGVTAGTYTNPTVTFDALGRATSAASGSAGPRVQYGLSGACPVGGNSGTVAVVFPVAFATVPVVVTCPDNYPRAGNEPFDCYPTNITTTGFTANFGCSVPTGGGGAIITNTVHANWIALGT